MGYLLVGKDAESEMYVKFKKKACDSLGIDYVGYHVEAGATVQEMQKRVREMDEDQSVNGILVQLPLPSVETEA